MVARYSSAGKRLGASKAAGARFVAQQGWFGFASVVTLALVVMLLPTHTRTLANGSVFALNDPSRILRLPVTINKSEIIRFEQPFATALVANPEYADITPLTDRSLYIIGKKVGETRVTVLDRAERLLGVIDVEVRR